MILLSASNSSRTGTIKVLQLCSGFLDSSSHRPSWPQPCRTWLVPTALLLTDLLSSSVLRMISSTKMLQQSLRVAFTAMDCSLRAANGTTTPTSLVIPKLRSYSLRCLCCICCQLWTVKYQRPVSTTAPCIRYYQELVPCQPLVTLQTTSSWWNYLLRTLKISGLRLVWLLSWLLSSDEVKTYTRFLILRCYL